MKKGWIEFAPAPLSCNDGDLVSQVALSGPPAVEHAVLAGGEVVAVCATGLAAVVVVPLAALAGAEVVGGIVAVIVVVVLSVFFLDAAGDDEPHAAAPSATAARQSVSVDTRGRVRRPASGPRRGSRVRRTAPRCTGSPLQGGETPPRLLLQVNISIT